MIMNRAVIFANGEIQNTSQVKASIQKNDYLIAADAGAEKMLNLGLMPAVAIGDFDSISETTLQKLESDGVEMLLYPADKDKTDLELAIDLALDRGARKILVVAAFGGRLDMTLSNISLLSRHDLERIDIAMDDGVQVVSLITGSTRIKGNPGDLVSLIPWAGDVEGVITKGLRWSLKGETLKSSTSRAVSNEMVGAIAEITLQNGLLLCIHSRTGGS